MYMTAGMATKAGALYATLSEWCSQGVQLTTASSGSNPFKQPRFKVRSGCATSCMPSYSPALCAVLVMAFDRLCPVNVTSHSE